jgi:hypothetical protein
MPQDNTKDHLKAERVVVAGGQNGWQSDHFSRVQPNVIEL